MITSWICREWTLTSQKNSQPFLLVSRNLSIMIILWLLVWILKIHCYRMLFLGMKAIIPSQKNKFKMSNLQWLSKKQYHKKMKDSLKNNFPKNQPIISLLYPRYQEAWANPQQYLELQFQLNNRLLLSANPYRSNK